MLDQFVDAGGIEADGLGFGLEAFGALELRSGLHVHLQGQGELLTGLKALEQGFEAAVESRLADGGDVGLFEGVLEDAVHQGLQGGRPNLQGTDLLHQHRAGHLALAEAGEFHAAAQLLDGRVMAPLGALPRNGNFDRHPAAGTGAGAQLEICLFGSGFAGGASGRAHGCDRDVGPNSRLGQPTILSSHL